MTTISITIPSGVNAPKFHLFQEVRRGTQQGVIIAMRYVCPLDALSQSLGRYGWEYDISFMFGKPPECVVNAREPEQFVFESELSPLTACV